VIVLDASVMIAYLDDRDVHHDRARGVMLMDEAFAVHTVNLAETLVYGAHTDRVDEMATALAAVGIHEQPRVPAESRTLAELRSRTRLKLPDCCALALAEIHDALATFDDRLATVA
jgi:predicted nucleic acid-binding protein